MPAAPGISKPCSHTTQRLVPLKASTDTQVILTAIFLSISEGGTMSTGQAFLHQSNMQKEKKGAVGLRNRSQAIGCQEVMWGRGTPYGAEVEPVPAMSIVKASGIPSASPVTTGKGAAQETAPKESHSGCWTL